MINCTCLIQEDQIPDGNLPKLEDGLDAIAQKHFSQQATVSWVRVREDNGFTDAKKSTTSLCVMNVPDLEQHRRVLVLTDICDLWVNVTGCSLNEIVANVVN